MRHNLLGVWLFVCLGAQASFSQGLTPATPAKEYIRLNGSVVAIENAAPTVPTISINGPVGGATVTGTITVGVTVGGTITSVQLKVDGTNVGAAVGYPYALTFNSTLVSNGSHTLIAEAVGPAGTTGSTPVSITVDNTSVSITAPVSGAAIAGASVPITVVANGSVTSVQLQVDGVNRGSPATVSPFGLTLDTTTLGNGSHTLVAVAASGIGPVNSPGVLVTVANISVSIALPAAGATISGSTLVTFSTTGPVSSVQLRVDNANWGSPAVSSPFGVTLDTMTLSNGSHNLTAIATGPAGNVTSGAVAVTVNNVAPKTAFVTGFLSGTARNNFTGLVGTQFTVGNTALSVTDLGRMYISGSGTHTVRLVLASSGADVPGGLVSITGGTPEQFHYAALSTPVTLLANTAYYIVSQETSGGDPWYDSDGALATTSAASIIGQVYHDVNWVASTGPNQSYGPLNFQYAVSAPPVSVAITAPVTGASVSGTATPVTVSTTGGVTSVQLHANGGNLGNPSTTAPFGLTFNTTTFGNGGLKITATASDGAGGTAYSLPVTVNINNTSAPPPGTPFVTAFSPGVVRNNYAGFAGMQFTVGATSLTVTELGRMYISGSGTHLVKLVLASNGTDVPGGSVMLSLAGGTPGQFQYAALNTTIILAANTTYYLVSQEAAGGDAWYDSGPVASTSVASVGGPVLGTPVSGLPRQAYVPVNFKYAASTPSISVLLTAPAAGATISGASVPVTVAVSGSVGSVQLQVDGTNVGSPATSSPFSSTLDASGLSNGTHTLTAVASDGAGGTAYSLPVTVTVSNALPSTAFVTGFVGGTVRNNYGSFVGMKITVGATPLTVTALGRAYLSGSGTHTLKLVTASTGVDVTGGSVSVSGGTAGQFTYGTLTSPVTLAANTAYYVLSGETVGGDPWYDDDTTITATSVASLGGPVYGTGPGNWTPIGTLAGKSFVPVNLKYQTSAPPSMTISITAPAAGATISGASAAVTVGTSGPVTSVQLQVDGVNKGSPATSSPFNLTLDTTTLSNAAHALTAVASDGSGGTVTSAPVSVTVNNGPPPTGTAFVTSFGTSGTRADFNGFVGMGFTVGATPITVTQLGRLYVSGSGTHTLKLVQVVGSTWVDVAGGSVTITAGGTPGQFQYGSLGAGATLAANTAYYVVSGETIGGDPWYDWIPVTTTSVATGNGPVYGNSTYTLISSLAGQAYGPVNFKY